jgi:hypothetical protein
MLLGKMHAVHRAGFESRLLAIAALQDEIEARNKSGGKSGASREFSVPATLHRVPGLGDVSSTRARDTRDEGELRELVGEGVAGYIMDNKLFGFSE